MPAEVADSDALGMMLQGLLYRAVDDELASDFAKRIDDKTFTLALRISEHQEATGKSHTPDQIRGAALLVGCDQDVVLAMLGFLRSPVTGFYHSLHDPFCGVLVVDDDRRDVMRALYVHRACCPDAQIGDVMLRSDAEEWRPDLLRGPLYSGDPIRDVVLYQQRVGQA
jgi:hypothetical protein